MAEFVFKSGVKTLEVKDSEGKVLRTLSIDVGNKDKVKAWMRKLSEIQQVKTDVSGENVEVFDQLEELEKNVIISVLGEEEWKALWEIANHNVLGMLGFITYLSTFLRESIEGFYKEYV